jgi:uncharacterized damage-inducible protein DinB
MSPSSRASRGSKSIDEVALTRGWLDWLVDTRPSYLEALLKLPQKERHKDRGASFPSIQDIFLHILNNNVWWFESVPRDRQEVHKDVEGRLTAPQIRRQVRRIATLTRGLSKSLTPSRLNQKYTIRGVRGDGKPFVMTKTLRTIIWHMVEEELQHRGEMNALFWQMDVDAPTRAWFSSPLAE